MLGRYARMLINDSPAQADPLPHVAVRKQPFPRLCNSPKCGTSARGKLDFHYTHSGVWRARVKHYTKVNNRVEGQKKNKQINNMSYRLFSSNIFVSNDPTYAFTSRTHTHKSCVDEIFSGIVQRKKKNTRVLELLGDENDARGRSLKVTNVGFKGAHLLENFE